MEIWYDRRMKIKLLKDCTIPTEQLLHPGEGCDCSMKVDTFHAAGDEFEDYEINGRVDISGLKYRVDYDIIEYP